MCGELSTRHVQQLQHFIRKGGQGPLRRWRSLRSRIAVFRQLGFGKQLLCEKLSIVLLRRRGRLHDHSAKLRAAAPWDEILPCGKMAKDRILSNRSVIAKTVTGRFTRACSRLLPAPRFVLPTRHEELLYAAYIHRRETSRNVLDSKLSKSIMRMLPSAANQRVGNGEEVVTFRAALSAEPRS
jgi:hypothetical protein